MMIQKMIMTILRLDQLRLAYKRTHAWEFVIVLEVNFDPTNNFNLKNILRLNAKQCLDYCTGLV